MSAPPEQIRLSAESRYRDELEALSTNDSFAKPAGWMLSPWMVETYILGPSEKFKGPADGLASGAFSTAPLFHDELSLSYRRSEATVGTAPEFSHDAGGEGDDDAPVLDVDPFEMRFDLRPASDFHPLAFGQGS